MNTQKTEYYNKLHKQIGRKLHLYYKAVAALRSMYISGELGFGEMYEKAALKIEYKVSPKKLKVWFEVQKFLKTAQIPQWQTLLEPPNYEDAGKPA